MPYVAYATTAKAVQDVIAVAVCTSMFDGRTSLGRRRRGGST